MEKMAKEPNNKLDTIWSETCQNQTWEILPFWVWRELRIGFECQDLLYNFGSQPDDVKSELSGIVGSYRHCAEQEPVPIQQGKCAHSAQ